MRVLVIGLSRDLPLSPADALDFADILIRRAANQQAEGKYSYLLTYKLGHDKTNKVAWAPLQDLDQNQQGFLPSLIKVFPVHLTLLHSERPKL